MKFFKLIVAAGLAAAATGALAETGVNTADSGYVASVYGRASIPAVKIVGPLVVRPADVNVAGRDVVWGATAKAVTTKEVDVNEVLGRA